MTESCRQCSPEELDSAFVAMDEAGSGEVDTDEFLKWLRSNDTLAAHLRNRMDMAGQHLTGLDDHDFLDSLKAEELARHKLVKLTKENN